MFKALDGDDLTLRIFSPGDLKVRLTSDDTDGETADSQVAPASTEHDERITRDIALATFTNVKSIIIGQTLADVIVFSFIVSRFDALLPAIWMILSTVVNAARYVITDGRFGARTAHETPALYLKRVVLLGGLRSFVWSFLPFCQVWLGISPTEGPLTAVTLAYVGGAVALSNYHYRLLRIAIVPMSVSLSLAIFAYRDPGEYLLGFGLIVYLIVALGIGKRANKFYEKGLELKYRNESLISRLEQANEQEEAARRRFEFLAHHDTLTGLHNRASFNQELERAMHDVHSGGIQLAIILVDIDHFKAVNDTLGHSAGDMLLIEAAHRFNASAPPKSHVSRLGGDEFAILLHSTDAIAEARITAQKILEANRQPLMLGSRSAVLSTSIGIACAPVHAERSEELIFRADLALYYSKDKGRQRCTLFDAELYAATQTRRTLETDLPTAMDCGDVELFFQPQVRLTDSRIIGFEGLLRWQHPQYGWIAPPDIVATAQALNMSDRLNHLVLDTCIQLVRDLKQAGYDEPRIAANLSPRDLIAGRIADRVAALLNQYDVDPARLEIEITEEAMLDIEAAREALEQLESIGVRLSVDDFGVGYSSLAYLHQLKVDAIKIDKRFVATIDSSESDRALVGAMLAVGRSLGVEVIAEGIENRSIVAGLLELGCVYGQGFFFSKPMPLRHVLPWLDGLKSRDAVAGPLLSVARGQALRP